MRGGVGSELCLVAVRVALFCYCFFFSFRGCPGVYDCALDCALFCFEGVPVVVSLFSGSLVSGGLWSFFGRDGVLRVWQCSRGVRQSVLGGVESVLIVSPSGCAHNGLRVVLCVQDVSLLG